MFHLNLDCSSNPSFIQMNWKLLTDIIAGPGLIRVEWAKPVTLPGVELLLAQIRQNQSHMI